MTEMRSAKIMSGRVFAGARALYRAAVSYTHLDVYKRQVQDVREAVNADSGVSAYIQRYREVFTDYPS